MKKIAFHPKNSNKQRFWIYGIRTQNVSGGSCHVEKFVLSYDVYLRSEFRAVMSITMSA